MSTKMNNDDMVEVNVTLPKLKRPFPRKSEHLLPLRTSFRDYKEAGGRILISDENLETSLDDSEGVNMYTLCAQVGVLGHGCTIESKSKDVVVSAALSVCEAVIADVSPSMMGNMILNSQPGALRWIVGGGSSEVYPRAPPTDLMYRSASCYTKSAPLTMYTNVAVLEALHHSGNSNFWRSLYEPMEAVERHYSTPGIIYDNNLLSTGRMAGDDDRADVMKRTPSPDTGGFLDVIVTPQSKAAGRVRLLVAGTSIRVVTSRTIEMAYELVSGLTHNMGIGIGPWVLRCMGFCCKITYDEMITIVNRWKKMCERNMPTIHVFASRKVVVISIAPGTVIRPMRMHVVNDEFVFEGPYVDTMTVYHSDTLRVANLSFPSRIHEPRQYINAITMMYAPFSSFTTEPRPNLAAQMTLQGLNSLPVQGDATLVSMGEREPLVVTDFMNAVMATQTNENRISMPCKYMVTAFINRSLNMEDACSISKTYADSGAFAWMGEINYPIPPDCGHVRPGTVLKDQPWWKPNLEGIVTRVGMSRVGDPYAVALVGSKTIEVGDKLANVQGLKFTIGEKLSEEENPTLVDTETGDTFKASLLLSTKNLNRGLGGTVREMNACMNLFGSVTNFRNMQKPKGTRVFTFSDEKRVSPILRTAYIYANGKRLEFMDSNGEMRAVKCSYGIMSILQLRHIAALKQHYPSTITRSLIVKRGRYREGTPRVGETDLASILMQGLKVLAKECVVTSDLANFTICSGCDALPDLCDCDSPKPPVKEIACRWTAVQANMFLTLGMLNDPSKTPLTLRFKTHT